MTDEQAMQQKFVEYQLLQQHIESVQQQLQALNHQSSELSNLKEALSNLNNSKSDQESFSQVGPGIFVKSTVKETKEVLFNVGANVLVNKKTPDAVLSVEDQEKEISNSITELEDQAKKIISRIMQLQEEIQKLKK